MIAEGLSLMLIGMSGVFVFLLLLVGLMKASGRVFIVLDRFFPEPVPARATPQGPTRSEVAGDEEIAVVLAIASAAQEAGRA